jgi:hypothetical protein
MPLAFETDGLYRTRWADALLSWGLLFAALPAFRYLAAVLMLQTNGSVLAVGVLHASFNASGGLDVTPAGWQFVPAVIVLALMVAGYRAVRGRRADEPVVPTPSASPVITDPVQPARQH